MLYHNHTQSNTATWYTHACVKTLIPSRAVEVRNLNLVKHHAPLWRLYQVLSLYVCVCASVCVCALRLVMLWKAQTSYLAVSEHQQLLLKWADYTLNMINWCSTLCVGCKLLHQKKMKSLMYKEIPVSAARKQAESCSGASPWSGMTPCRKGLHNQRGRTCRGVKMKSLI